MTATEMIEKIAGFFKNPVEAKELLQKHLQINDKIGALESASLESSDGSSRLLVTFLRLMESVFNKRGEPLEIHTLSCELDFRGAPLFGGPSIPPDLDRLERMKDPGAVGVYFPPRH